MNTCIIVICCIHATFLLKSDAKKDTTCYGSDPDCTTHRLICNKTNTVIRINKAEFGYRSECHDSNGLASCTNTECCEEKDNDCYEPFTAKEFQNVSNTCTGQRECSVNGRRRFDNENLVCNGSVVSAYSKIKYTCISPDKLSTTKQTTSGLTPTTTASASLPTTSQHTTGIDPTPIPPSTDIPGDDNQIANDDNNNTGGIVGGIVGTLVVIVIVVIVIMLYRRKVQQKSNSEVPKTKTNGTVDPHYFTVDDAATLSRNITSEYDEIELDADTTPQYSEGYDHILAQQIKASKSKQNNNFNHIGNGEEPATDDDYNLLNRNKLQKVDPALAATYQHIEEDPANISKNNFITEDNYQHIGETPANSSKNNFITEDNYQHIGETPANSSKNNFITEDNYQHIGENPANSSKNNVITEDDYQHIGEKPANSSKNNFITEDNYQHIKENHKNSSKII